MSFHCSVDGSVCNDTEGVQVYVLLLDLCMDVIACCIFVEDATKSHVILVFFKFEYS